MSAVLESGVASAAALPTRPAAGPPYSEAVQRKLAALNRKRLLPSLVGDDWPAQLREEAQLRELEAEFVEQERQSLAPLLAGLPQQANAFMDWFEALRETGPGQGDPLFAWLAEQASLPEMQWFLTQEIAGEAGFDDLVALTQLRLPVRAKLELARNYWDEMGRGHEHGMHGPMLEATAHELELRPTLQDTVCEALALSNLMVALAANRRYTYQSLGALGVIEMTAPGRVAQVNTGLRRLGVSAAGRRYFQLHAGLDVKHSRAWNAEVIRPLVESRPDMAMAIAEGALLRLRCGARCFLRYRMELGLHLSRGQGLRRRLHRAG
ncbi:MAG: hypothetical protein NVS9B10_11360 [Nevskia sp.]